MPKFQGISPQFSQKYGTKLVPPSIGSFFNPIESVAYNTWITQYFLGHEARGTMQDFLWTPLTGSGLDADASLAASLPRVPWWNEKNRGSELGDFFMIQWGLMGTSW
jgi:hypothetical protein